MEVVLNGRKLSPVWFVLFVIFGFLMPVVAVTHQLGFWYGVAMLVWPFVHKTLKGCLPIGLWIVWFFVGLNVSYLVYGYVAILMFVLWIWFGSATGNIRIN